MSWIRRYPLAVVTLAWLGLLALFGQPLADRRPVEPDLRAGLELIVTSPRDDGLGSLREAIFTADRAQTRARIELRTPRIVLETPLPPLVNPNGIVIDATTWKTDIDARAVPNGPVFDLAAPRNHLRGLGLQGTAGACALVRASGTRFDRVTMGDCEVGILLAPGIRDLAVEDSVFDQNGTALRLEPGSGGVIVQNSRFRRHDGAGVWAAVASAPLRPSEPAVVLRGNRFEEDRISAVLVNVAAEVEGNQFLRPLEAAVYLYGAGVVRGNRILGGSRIGLFADDADGATIQDNEVSDVAGVGLLIRRGRGATIQGNRVYRSGYGIAVVFDGGGAPALLIQNLLMSQREDGVYVVGASPVVRGNRVMGSGGAALRILEYVPVRGRPIVSVPLLQDNTLQNNGTDAPLHGAYREVPARQEPR